MAKRAECEAREAVIRAGQPVGVRATLHSKAMESVRDLSWGLGLQPDAEEAHTGFEPVLPP